MTSPSRLTDAWAAALDVLTFYQERIANESYLRTATERLSVLHLARLIGYELRPGVAASTSLAFTLDETAGSPAALTLDGGPEGAEHPRSRRAAADLRDGRADRSAARAGTPSARG